MALIGNLVLMIIFAGYENFVSRIDVARQSPDKPSWMGHVDFTDLKLKLVASIVAISGINLLEAFMSIAHVGDSRIYHLSETGSFNQLSKDHTHIAWLKEKGEISDYEARNDPRRNILHQVIGGKTQALNPQFGELVLKSKDRVLICSDGLIEGLMDSALKRMLNFHDPIYEANSKGVAQIMVDESIREDGKDNTTALCFEVLDAN